MLNNNNKRSALLTATKPIVHYESMFSDLPRFPRQSWVAVKVSPSEQNHVLTTRSRRSHSEVGGRDQAKFIKRPLRPNTDPPPSGVRLYRQQGTEEGGTSIIGRRVKEMSLNGFPEKKFLHLFDRDLGRKRSNAKDEEEMNPEIDSNCDGRETTRKESSVMTSSAAQTCFRDSETQTLPCSLTGHQRDPATGMRRVIYPQPDDPDVTALEPITAFNGLMDADMGLAQALLDQKRKADHLLATAQRQREESRRVVLLRRALESREKAEWSASAHMTGRGRAVRADALKDAMEAFTVDSERRVEARLYALSEVQAVRERQREEKMRKAHEKEWRALKSKHAGKTVEPKKKWAVPDIDVYQMPPYEHEPDQWMQLPGQSKAAAKANNNYESKLRGLEDLQRTLSRQLNSMPESLLRQLEGDLEQPDKSVPQQYLPRAKQYDHLLDVVYNEIQVSKAKRSLEEDTDPNLALFKRREIPEVIEPVEEVSVSSSYSGGSASELVLLGGGSERISRKSFSAFLEGVVTSTISGAVRNLVGGEAPRRVVLEMSVSPRAEVENNV